MVLGYNAHAAVDCDTGLVVASEVTQSSADRGELTVMAESISSQLGEAAQGVELVADSGYDSYGGLQTCENLGIDAVVAPQDGTAGFWTPVSQTEIVCPMGESPSASRSSTNNGRPSTIYSVPVCRSCRFYGVCCTSRHGRSLNVPLGCDPVLRVIQAQRARSPDGREAMRERMATVEPFFGSIKWNMGMGRLFYRGLAGARLEFGMMVLARNVRLLGRALAAPLRALLRSFQEICPYARWQQADISAP